ncbi:MAG: glycosyltransferase [Gemmataceae bacterium]|nr:glycosyltransferase [Gemmataceae bacterium]
MITGRDFIILSDDFDGLPTSAIHLCRRLAQRNRVFWFNTVSRLPRFSRADAMQVLRTVGSWVRGGSRPPSSGGRGDSVRIVNPMMVPWFKPLARRFNRFSWVRQYRKLCTRHEIVDPIVLTTVPYGIDLLKALPDATRIYYCVDDFLDYPGVNRRDWARMEAELLDCVDGLIVTSQPLAEKRARACPLLYLPHGVEFDHFQVSAAAAPVPFLEALPRPIVGFFGLVSAWVDLDLIAYLSECYPEASFVVLGRCEVSVERLARRPNVHCFGLIPYADLPRHARYFDVGLIPFVLSQLTRAVNPVKLMEYLALGLPVLSTRLPELETVEGPIRLAVTREEFRRGLAEALALRSVDTGDEARAVARDNTWDSRVEELSAFLDQFSRAPTARAVA